jgi:hypothetical protein
MSNEIPEYNSNIVESDVKDHEYLMVTFDK